MKKLTILLLLALSVALFGCGGEKGTEQAKAPEAPSGSASAPMTLALEWQRMIDEDGNVCCGSEGTRMEVETARAMLAQALESSGIKVVLVKTDFSPEECVGYPERANRVLVAGKGIDYWVSGEMASSPCGGFCKQTLGDEGACQNLVYDGKTYEVVPAELIVKAGMLAAADPVNLISRHCAASGGCPVADACTATHAGCPGTCPGDGTCPHPHDDCPGTCPAVGTCPYVNAGSPETCSGDGTCPQPHDGCPGTCSAVSTCPSAQAGSPASPDKNTEAEAKSAEASSCPSAKTCGSKACGLGG